MRKIVVATLLLGLVSASAVEAREEAVRQDMPPGPACVNPLLAPPRQGDAIRQAGEVGSIPCPQLLSTTTIPRPRGPQRT